MSRPAKAFFVASIAASAATVWGVHWLQKWESDNMYQGVIKDEARVAAKAAALLASASSAISPSPSSSPSSPSPSSSLPPLNTPSAPIQQPVTQPAPQVDPDCQTCVISPPPQLLEQQSAEARARERALRQREYEEQKGLAGRLRVEQGVREGGRDV
ncbi:hypothetical protein IAT38_000334 [Cryptococcus sp. DSM 104549]